MEETHFEFQRELDVDFLNSIYDNDLEYAEMIFEQYLVQAPLLVKNMEESFIKGVVEEFRQKVHKMKPVFSYVGLTNITAQAELLEKRCKEVPHLSELGQLYNAFKNTIDQFQPVIENQLLKLKEQTSV